MSKIFYFFFEIAHKKNGVIKKEWSLNMYEAELIKEKKYLCGLIEKR